MATRREAGRGDNGDAGAGTRLAPGLSACGFGTAIARRIAGRHLHARDRRRHCPGAAMAPPPATASRSGTRSRLSSPDHAPVTGRAIRRERAIIPRKYAPQARVVGVRGQRHLDLPRGRWRRHQPTARGGQAAHAIRSRASKSARNRETEGPKIGNAAVSARLHHRAFQHNQHVCEGVTVRVAGLQFASPCKAGSFAAIQRERLSARKRGTGFVRLAQVQRHAADRTATGAIGVEDQTATARRQENIRSIGSSTPARAGSDSLGPIPSRYPSSTARSRSCLPGEKRQRLPLLTWRG